MTMTKSELYSRAKALDIKGRSRMNKGELELAIGLAKVKDILVDTILVEKIKARIPERTALVTGQGRNGQTTGPDGKVVTLATLLAVCDEGVDKLDKYNRPGRELPDCQPEHEYGVDGVRLDPSYPIDVADPSPLVFDTLVNASELLEAGYTFNMDESRFRGSSEAGIIKLAKSGQVPPDYHGEATTVGSIGENRFASLREMLTDSLVGFAFGAYRVEDKTITLENFQAAMMDPKLDYHLESAYIARLSYLAHMSSFETIEEQRLEREMIAILGLPRYNSKTRLKKAYRLAQFMTADQLESDEISDEYRNGIQPDTLVLERAEVVETVAEKMDLLDRSEQDFQDLQSFNAQWDKTSYEVAREEMKSFRIHVIEKQRDNFIRVLNWVFSSTVKNVSSAFSYPNGSFHRGKDDRDTEGDPKLTPNQKVLLDMAAAIKTGRNIKNSQKALYENVSYDSPWEIWMVTGERSPTWNEENEQDSPF